MEKHMKQTICILLVLMLALLSVGCNNTSSNQNEGNSSGNQTQNPGILLPGDPGDDGYDPNISTEILYDLDLELTLNPLVDPYYSCRGPADRLIPGSVNIMASYKNLPVVSIWSGSFAGCKWVTDVTVENGVLYIYGQSFTFCTGLTKITLPATITTIGMEAFAGCSSLAEIVFDGSMSQWEAIEKGENWAAGIEKCVIRCLDGNIQLTTQPAQ